jgi:probable rRNA maturation factor
MNLPLVRRVRRPIPRGDAGPPRATRGPFVAQSGPALGPSRPSLVLSLQWADSTDRGLVPRHKALRWIRAALDVPAEITVRIVGEDEGRALNRDYRAKDYATNVLTFDYERAPVVVADLVLCAPVLRREARELGVALEAHYAHLLVHGTLHAQGHDHEADAQARVMERRETDLMLALGFADPYAR